MSLTIEEHVLIRPVNTLEPLTIMWTVMIVLAMPILLRFRSCRKYPTAKGKLPLIGAALEYKKSPTEFLKKAVKSYGDIFSVNLLLVQPTFIVGLEANQAFYEAKEDTLNFIDALGNFVRPIMPPSIWKHAPVLNENIKTGLQAKSQMLNFTLRIFQNSTQFLKGLDGQQREIFHLASDFTTLTNIYCLFGDEVSDKHYEEMATIFEEIERDLSNPLKILLPHWLPHPGAKRLWRNRERFVEIVNNNISERLAYPEHWQKSQDYLQILINNNSIVHLRHEFANHIMGGAFAAHTNTAGVIGWTIAELARDQVIQQRLRNEISSLTSELEQGSNAEIFYHKILQARYLDAILKEVMRFYTTILAFRKAKVDFVHNGIVIPKGTLVCNSPYILAHDSSNFVDPERFNPDRFYHDPGFYQSVNKPPKMAFVPWGAHHHRCVGEKFANLVMKTFLAKLITTYKISLEENRPFPEPDYGKLGTPWAKEPAVVKFSKLK